MDFDIWYYKHQADIGYSKMKKAFEAGQQSKQAEIDAHNKKLSLFIDELKKTHSDDKDNKMDYWRGFSDCAEASVKVFYRDVGFAGEDNK